MPCTARECCVYSIVIFNFMPLRASILLRKRQKQSQRRSLCSGYCKATFIFPTFLEALFKTCILAFILLVLNVLGKRFARSAFFCEIIGLPYYKYNAIYQTEVPLAEEYHSRIYYKLLPNLAYVNGTHIQSFYLISKTCQKYISPIALFPHRECLFMKPSSLL